MSIEQVKVGDYVRVVFEGEVEEKWENGFYLTGPSLPYVPLDSENVKSVEKIPEPEDFRPDDVVLTANGSLMRLGPDKYWTILDSPVAPWRSGDRCYYVIPSRPLILLVRDGQVVTK